MSREAEEIIKQQPRLFLSYCDKDRSIVEDVVTFIRTLQITLIMDKEVLLASNFISETLRGLIQSCHGCLWILTENSVKSGWCPVEVGAFWGAGLPVIIYNPFGINYEGPFRDIKQARSLDDLKRAIAGLEVRGKVFTTVTVEEATKIIERSVNIAVEPITKYLPMMIDEFTKLQNEPLQNKPLKNHAAVLSEITRMLKRAPKKLMCAFDVPSFGSVSAERDYRICCDVFDTYIAKEEWDVTILLLPADVGVKIVNTEFTDLQKRRQAWAEDIDALRRFQGYKQRARQRGDRRIKLGWLAINRDANGAPSGLHSMPLNVWIADDDEAVFSTVIDNYNPTGESLNNSGSQVQEIGFSTRNPDMVRFLIEITEKYAKNIDETLTLAGQIAASEEAKSKIERSIKERGNNRNVN